VQMKPHSPRNFTFAVLLASAFFAGCGHAGAPAHPAIPVRVSTVGTLEESGGLRYSANVEAFTEVNLAFKSGG